MENIKLINFVDLSLEEKKMILEWRNHPDIKKWMYNQNNIKLDEHLAFIDSLNCQDNKLYFLVRQDTENIGVIDFYNFDNKISSEFGFYSNPYTKVAGIGRILENISINYAFETLQVKVLKLEVFSDNIQVRNLHKKFKFKEVSKKIVNNKEVICMELER